MPSFTDPKAWQRDTKAMLTRKTRSVHLSFKEEVKKAKEIFIQLSQGTLSTDDRKYLGYPYARNREPFRYGRRGLIPRGTAPRPDYVINKNRQGNNGLLADSYRILFRQVGSTEQYAIINTAHPDNIVLRLQSRRSKMRTRGTAAEVNRRIRRRALRNMRKAYMEA